MAGVVLLLAMVAGAWFARDALLVWAQDKAVERLARQGVHVTLGTPRWLAAGGVELSDLRLHADSGRETDLLRLGRVRVQPDYARLIRDRQVDLVVASQGESLWITGMDEHERVGLDDVEVVYRDGQLELLRGNLGVSGVRVAAAGRIPTRGRDRGDETEREEREPTRPQRDERDLEAVFSQVGIIVAEVLEWTRLHAGDDAVAPVLTLLLDEPSGGVTATLEGERFDWQGLTWDRVRIESVWLGEVVEIIGWNLVAADCEVHLNGRHLLAEQTLEIDEWRVTGNPLGPLVARGGDPGQTAGWEVVRPVVIEGRDLRLPLKDLDQVSGSLRVVEPGELRWTHPEIDGERSTILTLDEWRLQAELAHGRLEVGELGLGGGVMRGSGQVMPVKLAATGHWQIEENVVEVPSWSVHGDLVKITAAMLPDLTRLLIDWTLPEPVTLAGSGWHLPLNEVAEASGSLSSPDPVRVRWQPEPAAGEEGAAAAELELPQLRLELADGRLQATGLEGWIGLIGDDEDKRVAVELTAGLPLGEGDLNVDHLSLVGDLPALLAGVMPRIAPAMNNLGWSGDQAGLELRDAVLPLGSPEQFRAQVATTAPVDFVWRLNEEQELAFEGAELEGRWLDHGLQIDRIEAGWLGGRLKGDVGMPLKEGFDGLIGKLAWTDSHGALEVPFAWSVAENRLVLGADTRSRADLLALWEATPWGAGSLPPGLEFVSPPGLKLEQPLVLAFDDLAATGVDLAVTEPGALLAPVGDEKQLEAGILQLQAQLRDGLWSLSGIDAVVAEGELTGTAASREDGLWQIDAVWSDGDVGKLLDSFGFERRETSGSRGHLTFNGVVGAALADVNGGGTLTLREASLVDVMILREIYQLIAIVLPVFQSPGVGTVTADYHMQDGVLKIENAVARSDTIVVRAGGDVDFNRERLEIQARANLQGIVGLATAVASHALEIEVVGGFDDFQVRLRNAGAFAGVPGFVVDSSRIVIQSGYKAPIKILEIGADGGMRVLGEGVRVIEGGARLLEQGVRAPGGLIRRLPFLGSDRDEPQPAPEDQK